MMWRENGEMDREPGASASRGRRAVRRAGDGRHPHTHARGAPTQRRLQRLLSNKSCRAAETRGLGHHPLIGLADARAWCHRRGGDGRKAVPPRPLLEVGRDRPTVPGGSPERGGGKGAKEKRRTVTLLELERTFKRGWLSRSVDGCRRVALSCCKGLTG